MKEEVMFNVVTIAREYGSGGGEVGRRAAELLGWELVDGQIIERVAAMGKVDPRWAEQADEQSCAWWERVLDGFRHGGPEVFLGGIADTGVDRDALQQFTAHAIEEAGKTGNCVIVGRASQCVLRNNPRVMRVLVYAPLKEKIERVKQRHPHERDLPALMNRMDSERRRYPQDYYGCNAAELGLYHLFINSTLGMDACAGLIVSAIHSSGIEQRPEKAQTPV
jgi:cytidylate kinase